MRKAADPGRQGGGRGQVRGTSGRKGIRTGAGDGATHKIDHPLRTGRHEETVRVLDALGIAGLVADEEGTIIAATAACETLFGVGEGELEGLDLSGFLGVRVRPDAAVPAAHIRTSCRTARGDFPAEVTVTPLEEGVANLVTVRERSDERRSGEGTGSLQREISIFSAFSEILNRDTDRERILDESVGVLPGLLGGCGAWAHLADPGGVLSLKAFSGVDEAAVEHMRELRSGECLSGLVFASETPLLIREAASDPRVSRVNLTAFGIETLAAVPIAARGITRGVLAVAGRRSEDFSSLDMQLFGALGAQLGVAMENAELIDQLREKMNHIELTNELSGAINSSLSIGTIFRLMVAEIKKYIQYDRASLLLYDETKDQLVIFALDTAVRTSMAKGVKAPVEDTSAGWVVRNNRPWINRDLAEELAFPLDRRLRDEGMRSTVSIPLRQDKMLGVFNLDSRTPGKYSEQELQILLPAARQISIALENALLFEGISREKKEWERTFDAITDMVWIEDVRRNVMRANQALLRRTGMLGSEVSGIPCGEVLERIGVDEAGCLCCETLRNARQSFREVAGRDGDIYHFWAYPLLDDEGQLYAVVHYLKDVTERKRLEQQLVRADKLASLGTLVAGIAHEINNPLGIIAGYSEALLERAREDSLVEVEAFQDFPEYLGTIHNEIFRCKEILSSLLEFARPYSVRARELNLNEIIKEVILLVNHRAKRLHCRIEQDLDRDIPNLCAEPGSLRQLFMNIIINSMYHTPEGGVIRIRTSPERQGGRVTTIRVEISDNGAGIPRSVINQIFDPFFTTKPVGEGTGLGLAICHRIAEEHGGTIDVESEEGLGTTFRVRLPAKAEHGCGGSGVEGGPRDGSGDWEVVT